MKKLSVLWVAVALVLGISMSASADMVTITFDEPGISAGTNQNTDAYSGRFRPPIPE